MSDQPSTYCGGLFQTNGYLLDCGKNVVLFDAPHGVHEALQSKDIAPDLLILTHQHHDHIMDAAAVASTFQCPIYAYSEYDEDLVLKSNLEAATARSWEIPPFSVSKTLTEDEPLDIDGREFQVLHIPGHSPDSLCFFDKTSGLVIGGDVLFQNGIGRTDFPNGSYEVLIAGIKDKLWGLPDETVVYPGHGPQTSIGSEKRNNPFIR
ncbi:MAG: MBL fold metallo-hydrolase [Verrucomicrobiales bacterium]|nr:MBL fold metallo-hydrolase [Verrucomicrobiales bacterium]